MPSDLPRSGRGGCNGALGPPDTSSQSRTARAGHVRGRPPRGAHFAEPSLLRLGAVGHREPVVAKARLFVVGASSSNVCGASMMSCTCPTARRRRAPEVATFRSSTIRSARCNGPRLAWKGMQRVVFVFHQSGRTSALGSRRAFSWLALLERRARRRSSRAGSGVNGDGWARLLGGSCLQGASITACPAFTV